jgi:sugar lactone lactonase YvrE
MPWSRKLIGGLLLGVLGSAFTLCCSPAASADELATPTLVTIAGTGEAGAGGEKVSATSSPIFSPQGLAFDTKGRLNLAETLNHRIRRVGPSGKIVTVIGGDGTSGASAAGYAGDNDAAANVRFNLPRAITFDPDGNLFVLDSGNNRVRKVDSGGTVTTVVGNGPIGVGQGTFTGEGLTPLEAALDDPAGLTLDAQNHLTIADTGSHRVRQVGADGRLTTIAGDSSPGRTGDGGPATRAQLTSPAGLLFDASGNLYIADVAEHVVRKVDRSGTITTVAGTGTAGFSGDGQLATQAQLNQPRGLAMDTAGNLFIADSANHRVRKVDAQGMISTVAGNGQTLFAGEGGPALQAGLRGPVALAVDTAGNLFIGDTGVFADSLDHQGPGERLLKVNGVAAPGLQNGRPVPAP